MSVTIYHNPACSTSRKALDAIRDKGIEPLIIEYLKTPPSRDELKAVIAKSGETVRHFLRDRGTPYEVLGLDNEALSDDFLLDAMIAHPVLINRPIVVSDKGAVLCRPLERIFEVLP
ncbi:arsenate reductase (glutaredoxin) [Brucellaceae bacterium C25G]